MTRPAAVRGVSLIEVLVSLVVVSSGVLSAAALQLVVKRNNADAAQRMVAAQLARDMAEHLRANSGSLEVYVAGGRALGRGSLGPLEPQPDCSASAPCTPAQLAAHDRWAWEQALDGAAEQAAGDKAGGLALPTACIEETGDGAYAVTVAWRGAMPQPDNEAIACGRDPQPGGEAIYSRIGADNLFRRSLTLPLTVLAPRRPG